MLRNDYIKEFFGIPVIFVRQRSKSDSKVWRTMPRNGFASNELIATE